MVYIDDGIVISLKEGVIKDFIASLANGPEHFEFTEEGSLANYLSVQFTDFDSGNEFSMSQPFLIERILMTMGIEIWMTRSRPNPVTKSLLHKDTDGEIRRASWKYCSVIGMMNYLLQSTRPDIAMAIHQCTHFHNDPKLSHKLAVKRIP